jgi:hypothetical protein
VEKFYRTSNALLCQDRDPAPAGITSHRPNTIRQHSSPIFAAVGGGGLLNRNLLG